MLPKPRISNKALADLCHRLAVETDSGIDIRRTWQREADSATGRLKPYLAQIRDAVTRGGALAPAMASTGSVFPQLFLEMVHVGEQTGTLGRVFKRLEEHYQRQVRAQRAFLAGIAWPMIELAFAIVVIGVLIWVLGIVAKRNHGEPIDILGFGLIGNRGLFIYINFVIAVALCVAGLIAAMRRGVLWTRPLQRALLRLPGIGPCLEKLALARIAWALHLMLNVEIDLRRMLPLALRASGSDHYIQHTPQVTADVASGLPMHVALSRTHAFPARFLDALAVGEESGQAVESMGRLSDQYEQEAESAIKTLAVIAGFGVWILVAGVIVWLIFHLAGFYIGTINSLLK